MGLYTRNNILSERSNSIDHSRGSVDFGYGDLSKNINLGRDSVIDPTDIQAILRKKRKESRPLYRCRKRLNIYLHTHIALITVCILSSLDAVCVIGQVICDILIMSGQLTDYDDLHDRAKDLLIQVLPDFFSDNSTNYKEYSFEAFIDHIEEEYNGHNSTQSLHRIGTRLFQIQPLLSRVRRASAEVSTYAGGGHGHEEHDLLHELTHSFHIGSMVILSVLLAETFLKIFAMGRHFLNHKLEIFDAFVIAVSWSLDVAFWEGIWAMPGQEGATLLIVILPWRVIRIVNSFVLVIQEKDLVLLKVVKQRLRMALRKDKDSTAKLDKYRLEVRQLQGLCRKHGADESAIQACCPTGRRRRSSLFQSLTSLASVALVSAMGSAPTVEKDNVSSSDSDDQQDLDVQIDVRSVSRDDSMESGIVSYTPDHSTPYTGNSNKAFQFDDDTVHKIAFVNDGFSTKL